MRLIKEITLIFLMLTNMIVTNGCWNYREIEKMDVVIGLAIDKDKVDKKFKLTAEIIRPSVGERQSKFLSELYESKGNTILEAVRAMVTKTGRRTYWSHTSIIVISKEIAEGDISPVIDWLYRESETRGSMYILIPKGGEAAAIFRVGHNNESIRSDQLTYALQNQKRISKYPKTELANVVENFADKNSVVLLTVVDIKEDVDKVEPQVCGSAILKYDKVIGDLSGDETQDALWLRGELKGGVLVVENIIDKDSWITFKIVNTKTSLKPAYRNNRVEMAANIKAEVTIGEVGGNISFHKEDIEQEIRKEAEDALIKRLEKLVKKVQNEYHSDIFRFGNKIEMDNPRFWKQMQSRWGEEFSNTSVKINIELDIKGTELSGKPVKGGK